jgi:2,3-bisphosphoglycerate-independent phosphoglycerate mutase
VPTILCILDGWGIAPASNINGITTANTPCWTRFLKTYPHAQLQASELFVGLPKGQMGNSEVGHMTIGAGRVILQDLPRIDQSIEQGTLAQRAEWIDFVSALKKTKGACHVLGLLSPGGVHSHQLHIEALTKLLLQNDIPVHIHAILDGRDTPPQSAKKYLETFCSNTKQSLATIGGRYFAMDRDKRWDRIEKAYRGLAFGEGPRTDNPIDLLTAQYKQGIGDEFIPPHTVGNYAGMKDGDGLLMVNFRADRVRQILSAFLKPDFADFDRGKPIHFGATLGMGEYSTELTPLIPPLFRKQESTSPLGAVVATSGFKQLRIAETEKYAHVTFFLNGGREEIFPGEDRILVPSPDVATYDLKPEMSADEVTDNVVNAITKDRAKHNYSLIVINYANTDMVGHTGVQSAIVKAVETIDRCLGRLEQAAIEAGYAMLITADHGNVEQMIDETTGEIHTAHTCNPVPVALINGPSHYQDMADGQLSDLAPTILSLMGLPIPQDMAGKSLLKETRAHAMA